jgi:LmbE family N-acetylglucosaminyl deacetylase
MKIFIIAPHMDDEVLGVGGTIAKHVDQGDIVKVCVVAYDHKYDDKKIEEEKRSTKKAQKFLGYQNLEFLDLPDEQLDNKIIEIVIPLEKVYLDFKPDIVYINHHSDVNQDHQAVFKAGMIVCRTISSHKIKKMCSYEAPSSTDQSPPLLHWAFVPNFYVNIEPYLEKKIQALRCYDRESRVFPNPRSPEGIRNYAIKRGMEAGLNVAEAFYVLKEIW